MHSILGRGTRPNRVFGGRFGAKSRRDISYKDLAIRLEKAGVSESEANIANKLSRGGFSAVFLI